MLKEFLEYFGARAGLIMTPAMCKEYDDYVLANIAVGDGLTGDTPYYEHHAYTVIKRTAYTVTLQRDKAIIDPNFVPEFSANGVCRNSNRQSYTYERDPDGEIIVAHWSKKNGGYHHKDFVAFNEGRHEYHDYTYWGA